MHTSSTLTLPMGSTSSPDPTTTPFESGMPRLVLQSAILSRGTLTWCSPLLTLPMGGTSSPDPETAPFESGMPRLALQSEILSRGTLTGCSPLLTLPMGGTLSPDPPTAPFESGMRRLVHQSAILSRGMLTGWRPLLTLPIGSTSSPDPMRAPLGRGILTRSSLLHTPLTGGTSFLGLMATLPAYWTHFHMLVSNLPLLTQHILVFVPSPTRMVGSRTQRVAYYTGYPTTVVKAYTHLPF